MRDPPHAREDEFDEVMMDVYNIGPYPGLGGKAVDGRLRKCGPVTSVV
jgi:hypothetical protein